MKKLVPGFFICAAIISITSCSDEYTICETPVYVSLNAGFYEGNGTTANPAQPTSFSVSVLNGGTIYTNATGLASFSASLTPNVDTTAFVISIGSNVSDTVKVASSTQVQTVSTNCGDINVFTLSGIVTTHHTIDSVVIVNTAVNAGMLQNIKVCY